MGVLDGPVSVPVPVVGPCDHRPGPVRLQYARVPPLSAGQQGRQRRRGQEHSKLLLTTVNDELHDECRFPKVRRKAQPEPAKHFRSPTSYRWNMRYYYFSTTTFYGLGSASLMSP